MKPASILTRLHQAGAGGHDSPALNAVAENCSEGSFSLAGRLGPKHREHVLLRHFKPGDGMRQPFGLPGENRVPHRSDVGIVLNQYHMACKALESCRKTSDCPARKWLDQQRLPVRATREPR